MTVVEHQQAGFEAGRRLERALWKEQLAALEQWVRQQQQCRLWSWPCTNSVFRGNILALASITATTGAVVEGRLLARTAAVTLDTNTVTLPLP